MRISAAVGGDYELYSDTDLSFCSGEKLSSSRSRNAGVETFQSMAGIEEFDTDVPKATLREVSF